MHPYTTNCPTVPSHRSTKLVIGPLFYTWPSGYNPHIGRPRFGVGVKPVVDMFSSWGWRRALRQASLVICATERHSQQLRLQFPNLRVETLPVIVNSVPTYRVSAAQRPRSIRLLFIANMVYHKHPLMFCEIIRELVARGIDAHGAMLGDGPMLDEVCGTVQRMNLTKHITVAGRIEHAQVFDHLAEADMLVSLSVGEPYGRGIVEAMSCGVPAVCHRSGGPADYIVHRRTGLLVDDFTVAAYVAAIEQFVGSEHREQLGQAALQATHEWSAKIVLDSLEEMMLQVAGHAVANADRPEVSGPRLASTAA